MKSKQSIRKHMRQTRRQLSSAQMLQAAFEMYNQLRVQSSYRAADRVGVYLANDGELSLDFIIEDLWQRKIQCFLPVIFGYENNKMHFAPFLPTTRLIANRYQIPEPKLGIRRQSKATTLDLVLLPLVAFDKQGNRLGMGGGYYDRSFSFLHRRKQWHKPRLVGVAYDFQEVESLETESWDVPLDAIVTESRYIKIKR